MPVLIEEIYQSKTDIEEYQEEYNKATDKLKKLSLQDDSDRLDTWIGLISNYRIEREAEAISFVGKYPFLLNILKEAPGQIYRVFGEGITLYLELHCDPEEGWDELFIVIKSPYSTIEAVRRGDQLAEEWFLDRMVETEGKLNIVGELL